MRKVRCSRTVLAVALLTLVMTASLSYGAQLFAQDEYPVHLPLFYGPSGSTLPNGDFESGRTIWTESSKWGNVLIVQDDDLPRGIAPHGGSWAAWLGGDNDEEASIEQTVFIDPTLPYLAYWYWIDWPFSCQGATGAVATVSLDQTVIEQTPVCEDTDSGGWVQQVLDVQAFAGQSVNLRFELTTDINSFANLYIDDVTFQSAP